MVIAAAGLPRQRRQRLVDWVGGIGVVTARMVGHFSLGLGWHQDLTGRAMSAETQDVQTKQLHQQRHREGRGEEAGAGCAVQKLHDSKVCRLANGRKSHLRRGHDAQIRKTNGSAASPTPMTTLSGMESTKYGKPISKTPETRNSGLVILRP